ncbi:MAG: ribosomal protein [Schlesneria sp.]|jgi:small subunit ribosomal protein S13|nr:ribosomal protein [Schlesneria sp.]
MPRIQGVDIPSDKPTFIALQYLYGVGPHVAFEICHSVGIDPQRKSREMSEDVLARISALLDKDYTVEGQLRRQVQQNVMRLKDIQSYRGLRHRRGLPVRGQRTRTNARTRKGVKKTVAGKKGVKDMKH